MKNPILEALQTPISQTGIQSNKINNNPIGMLQQFNQFRQQMNGKDPKAMVQQLIASGQMSQQQFESLGQQANNFMKTFNIK